MRSRIKWMLRYTPPGQSRYRLGTLLLIAELPVSINNYPNVLQTITGIAKTDDGYFFERLRVHREIMVDEMRLKLREHPGASVC